MSAKYLLLSVFFLTTSQAAEVNFSKAYIIPDSAQLRVGGVEVRGDNASTQHELVLGFKSEDSSFSLVDNRLQAVFDVELVSQQLRGTQWRGRYDSGKNLYDTTFYFNGLVNGMVTGEMVHRSPDPEASSFLRTLVGGILSTEYLVDQKGDGKATWMDAHAYAQLIQDIDQANRDAQQAASTATTTTTTTKTSTTTTPVLRSYPTVQEIRYYLRLKRLLALEVKSDNGNWGASAEYRMDLGKDNIMRGSVGTPPDSYSNSDVTSNNGSISLELVR
jgi:hypothetical protein